MKNIPFERTIDLTTARENLEKTLQSYQIDWNIEVVGEFTYTAKCILYNKSGEFLDYGYGKGSREESITGAMFEATEHWFCKFPNSNNENVSFSSSMVYAENTRFSDYLPISILKDTPNGTMAFREYSQIGEREETSLYPVALSTPQYIDDLTSNKLINNSIDDFDYDVISRYSSNSGMAIGSNELEATIHGLLESIERDTLSKFLVEVFLKKNKTALNIINKKSLPDNISILLADVEKETKHKVILLELKNEFEIPTYCSVLQKSNFLIEIAGFGTSLSREHAAYRSIHELSQCYHATTLFHPKEFDNKSKQILSRFEQFSFHLKCAEFKIAELSDKIGYLETDFYNTSNIEVSFNLIHYLEKLVSIMENAGKKAYSSVINRLIGGQVITHSFIEQQDHFFCVTEGSFVFPQLRKFQKWHCEIYTMNKEK